MFVGGSTIGNYTNDVPNLGENYRGEGGRGRIVYDADVEDVDVKADGENLPLSSYSPLDGDIFRGLQRRI